MNFLLADDFDANSKGVLVFDKLVNNTYRKGKKINPHKSFGYLRTPELTYALKEFIEEKDVYKSRLIAIKQKIGTIIKNLYYKKKRE